MTAKTIARNIEQARRVYVDCVPARKPEAGTGIWDPARNLESGPEFGIRPGIRNPARKPESGTGEKQKTQTDMKW